MPVIINIETSAGACSVALSVDSNVEWNAQELEPMNQATRLAPFVAGAMEEITRRELKLDAVAVSTGPGSYTGLRIGMSLAKGLSFSMDVPLIGVETLKVIAVKAMFRNLNFTGQEILVPMVDARRMEVYTAAYDFRLDAVMEPQALIIKPDSFDNVAPGRPLWFMGDGAAKTREMISRPDCHWMEGVVPMAHDMVALSEKAFREGRFMDLAYGTPFYIKDYEAVHGENPLKHLLS